MIDRIRGRLLAKPPAGAVIDVGGVALALAVPLTTWERLGTVGSEAALFTHLHVREDLLQLYGFDAAADRETFLQLIAVNGVGPKMALAILSRFSGEALSGVVAEGDWRRLQTVPGVGRKTAERLMIELKDRLRVTSSVAGVTTGMKSSAAAEALRALETLGFPLAQADEAVRRAQKELGVEARTEEIVRRALKG